MSDKSTEQKKVQKIINKLVSEELVASDFYNGCLRAADHATKHQFKSVFKEIAEDELNDHAIKIIKFASHNGFELPVSYKDYEKYAETCVKQLNSLKKGQNAEYYIEQAIKSEIDAINSYQEILDDPVIPYDLRSIFFNNYYDECEHLEKLDTLHTVLQAGMLMGEY